MKTQEVVKNGLGSSCAGTARGEAVRAFFSELKFLANVQQVSSKPLVACNAGSSTHPFPCAVMAYQEGLGVHVSDKCKSCACLIPASYNLREMTCARHCPTLTTLEKGKFRLTV